MAAEVICRALRAVKTDEGWKAAGEEFLLPRTDAVALQRGRYLTIVDDDAAPAPAAAPAVEPKAKKGGAKPPAE
ncbi:hypothetical protein [Methylobacterium indicum]|uniref:Uncharacterized protein n=1 Tax=Methylobacterium indicum TaxID=1775910 RepID=A0A8H8WSF9_9HYPH|nr:hypothetical protein [Methylobacterium indicum]BCM83590.1 hypothetical protein mvi_20510 [Methylobacterium indicum]